MAEIKKIEVARIEPDPNNRQETVGHDIDVLAASIRESGLIQPIKVRPLPKAVGEKGRYMVVAGHRRLLAHKHLGWEYIDAIVDTGLAEEKDVTIRRIIENLQRKDPNPMEEARQYRIALDQGLTEAQIAKAIGLGSQPWRINYRLRLLNLEPEFQTLLTAGQITLNAAQEIAKLSGRDQTRVVKQINSGTLKTDGQVTAAVQAIQDKLSQDDIFSDGGRVASSKDLVTVKSMESRIEQVSMMVSKGWKDGECVVVQRVDPNRATLMADKIAAIRKALAMMENELRKSVAQAALVLDGEDPATEAQGEAPVEPVTETTAEAA
jgi:ParB/RepB/Spo0J family partition protein